MDFHNLDLTNVTLDWIDPYNLENRKWPKYIIVTFGLTLLLIGTILQFGIAFFEKYGGDPQKRSVINQVFILVKAKMIHIKARLN